MMISLLSSSEYFHLAPLKIADSLGESCGICFASGKFGSGLSGDQTELHYVNSFTQIKISVQNLPQKRVNRD